MSVAAADDDEAGGNTKTDVTAGDETNKATFSWSDTTLTVTGKGDLSKITVTDENTKVFSATGAGKVYTKSTTTAKGDDGKETTTTTSTAVKQGDTYNASTSYYEPTITYGEAMIPSTTWNQNYSMTSTFSLTLGENETMHAIYWGNNGATAYVTVSSSDAQAVKNSNNWEQLDGTTKYAYWCVFKGTYSGTEKSTITLNQSDFKDGVYTGDNYTITLLNADNRSTYGGTKSTITASVDNLYYSSDATNYTWLAKDATVEYTEGMKLYLGTVTVKDEAIEDNTTYFGSTHSDYLTSAVLSFAEYLPHAVGDTYNTVVFKTEKGETSLTQINNAITCALAKIGTITTLNLEDTQIDAFVAHESGNNNEDPSFFPGTLGSYSVTYSEANTTLTTLYTPAVGKNGATLKQGVFRYLVNLKYLFLGEGIETLDEKCLDESEFAGIDHDNKKLKLALTTISFPNSLKTAKALCMNGQTGVETLTFPAGMQEIEHAAFWGTNPKDVYFLGKEAPKVSAFAWGEANYISNNAMKNSVEDGQEGTTVTVDRATGYACRSNYVTKNGWYAMLHYPAECTREQAAKYTDITRKYTKIVYGDQNMGKVDANTDGNTQGTMYYYYEPGKETTDLKGKDKESGDAGITGNLTATKRFINIYPNGNYDGNYDGGYDDMYLKEQYQWPSMGMSQRAVIVAENNLLWDGVTSIAEGIKNAAKLDNANAESSYNGDGTEYIGLHQFVFAKGDVKTDDTKKWDMKTYADGEWHSICLPINITKGEMKQIFGAASEDKDGNPVYDIRLCKFNKVKRISEGEGKHLTLYFNDEKFHSATNDNDIVLEAHVSYMIKAKKSNAVNDDEIVLKDYVLVAGNPIPTNVQVTTTDEDTPATTADESSEDSGVSTQSNYQYYFIGTYLTGMTMPQYCYFFSKTKKIFRFQGGTTGKWNAYTSIVEAPEGVRDDELYFNGGSSSQDAKLFTAFENEDNGSTTGIDRVTIIADGEIVTTNANVYNLNGQLVSTRGLNGLPKGLYIQNGKKYIVK